jgi:hypothetical protein
MNFATDDELQRSVHYITRWDFGKRTSPASFQATHPIVFYLSNDIPTEYRDTVRQALLTWNHAFARIGIEDAIQVRDQPHKYIITSRREKMERTEGNPVGVPIEPIPQVEIRYRPRDELLTQALVGETPNL